MGKLEKRCHWKFGISFSFFLCCLSISYSSSCSVVRWRGCNVSMQSLPLQLGNLTTTRGILQTYPFMQRIPRSPSSPYVAPRHIPWSPYRSSIIEEEYPSSIFAIPGLPLNDVVTYEIFNSLSQRDSAKAMYVLRLPLPSPSSSSFEKNTTTGVLLMLPGGFPACGKRWSRRPCR